MYSSFRQRGLGRTGLPASWKEKILISLPGPGVFRKGVLIVSMFSWWLQGHPGSSTLVAYVFTWICLLFLTFLIGMRWLTIESVSSFLAVCATQLDHTALGPPAHTTAICVLSLFWRSAFSSTDFLLYWQPLSCSLFLGIGWMQALIFSCSSFHNRHLKLYISV